MKSYFLIFFLLVSAPCLLMAQNAKDGAIIDQDLTKDADFNGDGQIDRLTLHLSAKNISSPVAWTLTITSAGKQIYSYSSDDANIDHLFRTKGYVSGCNDYISCKKKYYYQDLLNSFLHGRKK